MKWEYFKDELHSSWHRKLRPWIESEECDKIYEFLKKESRRGKHISPLSSNVWRAFRETTYDNLNVVFMGLSPYHTFRNGAPVCNGLLMDCSITGYLQPSLEKFYDAMERDLCNGLDVNMIKDPNLSYLAHQGVLLINASLTCEKNKPGSHFQIKLWEPFIIYLLQEVLSDVRCPIVFLGEKASRYKKYVAPLTWVFELRHPASAAYNDTEWDSENIFNKINKILKDSNGTEIKWLKTNL